MPTMTNPETGETKEISMEEFMKMMRSGNGSLQQVVTHADGTTSSTTVYGNVADDGLDRSVNIFVDEDTFKAFIIRKLKKLTGGIEDPESEKDPDDLFEMTVDFTDSATMGILKATKEELSINLYTRDERKATFDHLREGSKSWKANPDGTIEFSGADLQGEHKAESLYMLAFWEMREFLRATGKLAELKKLGNCGSGVIIKATGQADDAKATIVRGRNRPDLPCNTFLFGGQMMRPYMDEMMTDAMMSGMSLEEKIEAAENGDPDIMEHLAQMYLNGDDVAQDFEKSAYWWEKLANTGNATGQFNIGLHYAKGCGVTRDFAKATEWMKKSAENGDEDAPFIIEKLKKAVDAEKIVSTGDAQAQADLAATYMFLGNSLNQMGPDKDYKLAFDMAQKSAAQNNGDGLWALALCYEHGRGVKKDVKKTVDCYKKGSLIGHPPSLHSLACYYARGEIVPKNMKMAFELSIRSAEYGYGLAMQTVGSCYQFANGVVGNMDTAIKWYETALKFIDDFELERKVQGFKMMQEADPKRAKEEYHGIDSTKKLIAADRDFLDKVDAAIEVNPTLKMCKEVEPLLKKIKEAKRLEEEKKRAETEKKAREAEEKRLKEEKRKDEIYNTIIASDPKTVSDVESIIKKLEGLGDWKDSASKLKEYEERKRICKEKYDAYLEKYPLKKEEPKVKLEIESLKKEIDSIVILDDGEKKAFKLLGIFIVVGLLDLVLGIAFEMAYVAVIGVVCTLFFGFVMFRAIKANITKSSNKRMKQKKLAELEAKMQEISSIPEFKE